MLIFLLGGITFWLIWRQNQLKSPKRQIRQTRIVATTDAITAIFTRLQIKLAAVPTTASKNLPKKDRNLPQVGNHVNIHWEKLLAVKPDIVYVDAELADEYRSKLKEQQIKMKALSLDNYADLLQVINYLGKKYHRTQAADKLIKQLKITPVKRTEQPKVLILMGMPGGGFLVMNQDSYLGGLVHKAGGKVVAADSASIYSTPSAETIAKADPDIIIRLAHAMPQQVTAEFNETFKQSPYNSLTAVKNKRVYDVKAPVFSPTANLKAPQAYAKIKEWLNQVEH